MVVKLSKDCVKQFFPMDGCPSIKIWYAGGHRKKSKKRFYEVLRSLRCSACQGKRDIILRALFIRVIHQLFFFLNAKICVHHLRVYAYFCKLRSPHEVTVQEFYCIQTKYRMISGSNTFPIPMENSTSIPNAMIVVCH